MLECFGVFSEVIAFVCIGLQFAAVRTLLSSHHRIAADAASARVNEVGEPSIAGFSPPISPRGLREAPDVSVPPTRVFSYSHPKSPPRCVSLAHAPHDNTRP